MPILCESYFEMYVQTVKCGDYFQAEDGPREFGNIFIVTKWIKTTETSLVLRHLEVNYKEVQFENRMLNIWIWWFRPLWA